MANRIIRTLYSPKLENAPLLSKLASSRRMSEVLGYLNYDNALSSRMSGMRRFLRSCGIDARELVDDAAVARHAAQGLRAQDQVLAVPSAAASSAVRGMSGGLARDGWLAAGNLGAVHQGEVFRSSRNCWAARDRAGRERFTEGDFAVFRLTPEKYHYTHVPVAGCVADFYAVQGRYHSCNPNAAVQLLTPYSKNRRVVTVIDTDCDGGEQIGYVAMIEVVALMVGQIEQRYSEERYDNPQPIEEGNAAAARARPRRCSGREAAPWS